MHYFCIKLLSVAGARRRCNFPSSSQSLSCSGVPAGRDHRYALSVARERIFVRALRSHLGIPCRILGLLLCHPTFEPQLLEPSCECSLHSIGGNVGAKCCDLAHYLFDWELVLA